MRSQIKLAIAVAVATLGADNTRQLCALTEVFPSPTPEAPEAHLHECPNCSGDGYKTPQFFAFPKSN